MTTSPLLSLAMLLAPVMPIHGHPHVSVQTADTQSTREALETIIADEWKFRAKEFGFPVDEGDPPATYLPDVSPQAHARRAAYWRKLQERLAALRPEDLPAEKRVDAAVLKVILDHFLIEYRAKSWEIPFNSDTSFWSDLSGAAGYDSVAKYDAHLSRLRQIPAHFEQHKQNMRSGLARGFSIPAVTLAGRDKSIEPFTSLDPQINPLYKPFQTIPAAIAPTDAKRLQDEASRVISQVAIPAYSQLLTFIRDEYMVKARRTIAARDMPDGATFYREQANLYTTLDLNPEEIHRIGLAEVASLEAEMNKLATSLGHKGSIAEFLQTMRSDPQFVAASPDELLWRTAWITKRVDGEIGKIIGHLPRQRFTVKPVPDEIAPFYTSGRGGREACWMNTYDLPSRPLYALTALTLHECSPGHSLQTAIAAEQEGRPRFRQRAYFSGYSEGWGLYSEWLGVQMGLYDTPYDELGRLSYAMWRASRLVIDTGIHHFGWSRDKAVSYLQDRTALSQHEIQTEIDRYISWPGQALSYKLGELKIRELRTTAENALGDRFDQAAFHDAFLGMGSVPLTVLETEMKIWMDNAVETERRSSTP